MRETLQEKFRSSQSDTAAIDSNYRIVAEHIEAKFRDTEVELELNCSSTICYVDWPYEHRELLPVRMKFQEGWPVEGFERYMIGFPTESGGIRQYLFRDGETVSIP